MQQVNLPLIANERLKPGLWQLEFDAAPLSSSMMPGQFLLLDCAPADVYLRRAIFPAFTMTDSQPTKIAVLQMTLAAAHLTDSGLAWLLSRSVGTPIDAIGPLGTGFTLPALAKNLLLVGQGVNLAPLMTLALQAVRQNFNVVIALEAVRGAELFPTQTLPPAVELRLATLDGSIGRRGHILDSLDELFLWADALAAIGSIDFYRALKVKLQQTRLRLTTDFAQVLLTDAPVNGCGWGACRRCGVTTDHGLKMACTDGPVFDLASLDLGGLDD